MKFGFRAKNRKGAQAQVERATEPMAAVAVDEFDFFSLD